MIWNSIPIMIGFDLTIIGLLVVTVTISWRYRLFWGDESRHLPGRWLILLGVLLSGLFYVADLVVMTLGAALHGMDAAMRAMEVLHHEIQWVVSALSIALICAGIVMIAIHRFQIDQKISESEKRISRARQSVFDSEIRFRSLVEQTPDSVYCFEFDPPVATDLPVGEQVARSYDAVLIECNQGFAESLGRSSAASAIGTVFRDMDSAKDTAAHEALITAFVENGYRLTDYDLRYTQPNGEHCALLVNLTGVVQGGALVRIWGAEKNVLDQRQTEEALTYRNRFRALIADISSRLITSADKQFEDGLIRCIEQVCLFFDVDRSTIIWFADDKESGRLLYHWNELGQPPEIGPTQENYPWISAQVRAGELVCINSLSELPDEAHVDLQTIRSFDLKSVVAVPLLVAGESSGVCTFGNVNRERSWSENELNDLRVVADLFANVILRIQGRRKLDVAMEELRLAKERLEAENVYLREEISATHGFEELIGESPQLRHCLTQVTQVAETDTPVLIQGETGTGKELIARALHSRSRRAARPLVKVNCAALPANLIESELFGHEQGAFTGAHKRKRGRFDLAHKGTLFLDEIGDFPLELQGKLLRVLQDGEFQRVGGSETISVDVRILAATNRDLQSAVDAGLFRADLFYRINMFPIYLPPLSAREGDIELLAEFFVVKHAARFGKEIHAISASMMERLKAHAWPGNVRELEGVIQRAIISAEGPVLELTDSLDAEIEAVQSSISDPQRVELSAAEKQHIQSILEKTRWVVGGSEGAAAQLGIPASTLRSKMKKLGISRPN